MVLFTYVVIVWLLSASSITNKIENEFSDNIYYAVCNQAVRQDKEKQV